MADGEGGLKSVVETLKELGPLAWFMIGAGSVLALIKRGYLIFGEKAELAKEVGRLTERVHHLEKDIAEREARIAQLEKP